MKRLTENKIGASYPLKDKASSKKGLFTDYDGFYAFFEAVNRLGEIEDILGNDYDLERLAVMMTQCMSMRDEVAERFRLTAKIPLDRLKDLVELEKNIPHVCRFCVGCEMEPKDGHGCDEYDSFVFSTRRLQELADADLDGRCVVLPSGGYCEKDGENALKSAMNTCYYHNNPVTRYIADAVAEKLTREEAEAALKGEQDG